MTALTFYTNPQSRGQIVRWILEETGVPYDTVVLDYGTTMKAPEYLAINPMGKVPAIRHGNTVVTEAAAITWGMMFGTVEKRPGFEAYAARLQTRPAAQRAQQIDAALMKK
ncbi:MAG: glutathione S-transferase [Gammaproteobacteria bacterium]|nr:glutathione S-transferase [Gammaproteobacteria bacterium]MDP2348771.1 glutathione S-transferase [Gammaproteobacteria bacterium]